MFEMPPALEAAWHTHGYYGSVSHNVKAIYQRYLGWFDGNPAHLWQHPPVEAGNALRRLHGRRRRCRREGAGLVDAGDLPLGSGGAQPRGVRRARPRRGEGAAGRRARAARLRHRERHLAQRLPLGRTGAAQRQLRHPDRRGSPDIVGALPPDSSSTRSRSGSTDRGLGPRPRHALGLPRPDGRLPHDPANGVLITCATAGATSR